jgi:hypothetical protein
MSKATRLIVIRSVVFGLCAFVLAALSGIKVYSPWDVAGFVLGAMVIWYLIETVVLKTLWQKKKTPAKRP